MITIPGVGWVFGEHKKRRTALHKSTGTLRYTTRWLILDADHQICRYYRALVPKYIGIQRSKYPGHITVMRPEYETPVYPEHWGKHEGRSITFYYSPIVQSGEVYYWINCFSVELEKIRAELGLYVDDKFTAQPVGFRKCFHMTIGNCKDLDE